MLGKQQALTLHYQKEGEGSCFQKENLVQHMFKGTYGSRTIRDTENLQHCLQTSPVHFKWWHDFRNGTMLGGRITVLRKLFFFGLNEFYSNKNYVQKLKNAKKKLFLIFDSII